MEEQGPPLCFSKWLVKQVAMNSSPYYTPHLSPQPPLANGGHKFEASTCTHTHTHTHTHIEGGVIGGNMSASPSLSEVQVESCLFPPAAKPPGSDKTLVLGGAGVRGMEIQGKFVKFTAIGVYLEDNAVESLAVKWKGKGADELTESVDFFADIVTGPFEKFTKVTTILPLTGQQYSAKVAENCVAYWKSIGKYSDAESEAIEKFLEVFKHENFPPGSSILFSQSPAGSLSISFSKDDSIPEHVSVVIENKQLSEAVLESIIGKHGVSPSAKQNLAQTLSELLKQY